MTKELIVHSIKGFRRKIRRIFQLIEKNDEKYNARFEKIEGKINGNGTPGYNVRLDRIEKTLASRKENKTLIVTLVAGGVGAGMGGIVATVVGFFFFS